MEIFLSFFPPPLLSSKVEFILGLSPSFSPLSLLFSPFFSLSVSLENPGCLWCISMQTPWEGVGVVGESPLPEDAGARGGHLRRHRLASRRNRCCPVYPGNSSGLSSHLDSGTSVTNSCPECFAVPATALLHLFLLSKLPFPSTHFPKPRMPQTQSTDLLKFRLAFPEENFPS